MNIYAFAIKILLLSKINALKSDKNKKKTDKNFKNCRIKML